MKASVQRLLDASGLVKFEINLSEALANLVKHANSNNQTAPVDIELGETGAVFRVEIFGYVGAQPFDLRDYAKPKTSLDPSAESRRVLGLMVKDVPCCACANANQFAHVVPVEEPV